MGALLLGAVAVVAFLYLRFSAPTVTVAEAVEGPVVQAFYATGTLQPPREYPIRSNVEGTLMRMPVDKGDRVSQGDAVAFVRVEEFEMRHAQAAADLELARSLAADPASPVLAEFDARIRAAVEHLELVQDELRRLEEMRADNAATPIEVDRARERAQTQKSQVETIRAQKAARKLELERDVVVRQKALDIAQWNLDQQTITAPIAGTVLDRPVPAGTRVKVNDLLLTVADISPANLVMRAQVDEEDKTRVRLQQNVTLTLYAYPGRIFHGSVIQVYPQADPDQRTFEVDVKVQSPDEAFASGMTGELAFVIQSKDRAVIVASQAVQGSGDAAVIWVIRNGQALRVDVAIGLRSIERTEVLSGISPGDQVVISPTVDLRDGQEVKVQAMDPRLAAEMNAPVEEQPVRGLLSS